MLRSFAERYGRWAVVAGASEGLGAAFASALATRGCSLVLVARRADKLDDVAASIRATHPVDVRTLARDLAELSWLDDLESLARDIQRDPSAMFLGLIAPESVSDESGKRLLVSGFWRVSRHVNYLGEILMATGLTLALGRPGELVPWLYPLYYVVLLVPRQIDDDRRCAEKYGPLWARYVERVRWRIVAGIW